MMASSTEELLLLPLLLLALPAVVDAVLWHGSWVGGGKAWKCGGDKRGDGGQVVQPYLSKLVRRMSH